MSESAQPEPSESQLRRGIPALLDLLRAAGFKAGTSEAIDAAQLLSATLDADESLDPVRVRRKLTTVFCKTADEVDRFGPIFDQWCDAYISFSLEPKSTPAAASDRASGADARDTAERAWWIRYQRPLAAFAVAAVAVGLAFQFGDGGDGPVVDDEAPIVDSRPQITDSNGGSETGPDPAAVVFEVEGQYFTAFQSRTTIRSAWAWGIVGVLILPATLLLLPTLRLSTSSHYSERKIKIKPWPPADTARRIVRPITAGTRLRLSRHRRIEPGSVWDTGGLRRARIDLRRTIERTIQRHGAPTIVYHAAKVRPSYLVLVHADSRDDYVVHWAERLHSKTLEVDVAFFGTEDDSKPPTVHRVNAHSLHIDQMFAINRLPEPPPGQRLIVVSDARVCIDNDGQLHQWVRQAGFGRWPERVWFTMREPRDWDEAEALLEMPLASNDPAFLVLPLDETALVAWSHLLTQDVLPTFHLSRPQRYPRLLVDSNRGGFLGDEPPGEDVLTELIRQLKLFLDESGYFWLCCCAVVPIIDARLTLLLGEKLFGDDEASGEHLPTTIAGVYPQLLMLPWISEQTMPTWLRLALIVSVPKSIQIEIRETVKALLDEQANLDGKELEFAGDDQQTRKARNLYIGFLDKRTPASLSMDFPHAWRPWIKELMPRHSLLRSLVLRVKAVLEELRTPGGTLGVGRRRLITATALVALVLTAFIGTMLVPAETWSPVLRGLLFREGSEPTLLRHGMGEINVALSPDGTTALTTDGRSAVRLWNLSDGQEIQRRFENMPQIVQARFDATGERFVTVSNRGQVQAWVTEPAVDEALFTWGPGEIPLLAAFTPDDEKILIARPGGELVYLDVNAPDDSDPGNRPGNSEVLFTDAAVSLDLDTIVVWNDRTWRVVDSDGTVYSGELTAAPDARITKMAVSPSGREVLLVSTDGRILGHGDWEKSPVIFEFDLDGNAAISGAFSADGEKAAVVMADGNVHIFDDIDSVLSVLSAPAGARPRDVSISPDGSWLIATTNTGLAHVWESQPSNTVRSFTESEGEILGLAVSRNQAIVTRRLESGLQQVWNVTTGAVRNYPDSPEVYRRSALSPDASEVILWGGDPAVLVWDTESGLRRVLFTSDEGDPVTAEWSRNGRSILVRTDTDNIITFDTRTGFERYHGTVVRGLGGQPAMSPDGRRLAYIGGDGVGRVEDIASGEVLADFDVADVGRDVAMAFSPDGSRLAVADGTASVIDVSRPLNRTDLDPRRNITWAIEYSPDGRTIATAGGGAITRAGWPPPTIWNADNGSEIVRIEALENTAPLLEYSDDGSRLALSDSDFLQVFDAITGQAVTPALRTGMDQVRVRFDSETGSVMLAGITLDSRAQEAAEVSKSSQSVSAVARYALPPKTSGGVFAFRVREAIGFFTLRSTTDQRTALILVLVVASVAMAVGGLRRRRIFETPSRDDGAQPTEAAS